MKRLLCLLSGMNAGGAKTFLMKIYRFLDRTEYQMDFCINVKEKCFYEDEILALGGIIYRIPSKSENTLEFKRQLTKIVRDNRYKYVLRITSNAAGFMDLKIAKKAGAEVCCARSSNSSDGGSLKACLAHCIGRILYGKYVDVKIAPSDLAAKYTFGEKAVKNGKVYVLHNGVDLDVFKFDKNSRQEIRNELGISDEIKLIGHIGRFNTQKNHTFLLDVFNAIHKKDANTKLVLVGKGELENEIRDKIKAYGLEEFVILTGVRSDVPKLLSAMDIFVFPSFYEGMPNTVIEAQATGLPCVISDTITREADITGLVDYFPLTASAEDWAKKVTSLESVNRNTSELLIERGYDIRYAVSQFTEYVYK